MSNMKSEVSRRVTPVLAWSSFVASVLGGSFAPGMWLGDAFATVVGTLGWLAPVAFVVLFALLIRDMGMDGEPNKTAVYAATVLPSLAAATPGSVGAWITERSRDLVNWAASPLVDALGTTSTTALTLALLGIALVFAQRAVKGGRKSKGAKATATAAA